ncbi:hypothetical protein TNCV_1135331 [Trichonephila clavipes]|nr:hypothetical protein TNCV_1135331 [Trichonephila clavipes]
MSAMINTLTSRIHQPSAGVEPATLGQRNAEAMVVKWPMSQNRGWHVMGSSLAPLKTCQTEKGCNCGNWSSHGHELLVGVVESWIPGTTNESPC